jgi:hypothetical protein
MMPSVTFTSTLAKIAAKAAKWYHMDPEEAVEFAWFSVSQTGDAAEVHQDFVRHYEAWKVQ